MESYRQVADDLRTAIKNGTYAPGDALPSENHLAQQYGLNRTTIRNAYGVLRGEGLVDVGPGRPTTVRQPQPRIRRDASERYQWEKDQVAHGGLPNDSHLSRDMGLAVEGTTLELFADELVPADRDIAAALGIEAGGQVRHYGWLLRAGGDPGRIAHHWYPAELDEMIRSSHPMYAIRPHDPTIIWPGGTFYQLATHGMEAARVDDLVTARMPLADEVAMLGLRQGVPLVVVRKITVDTEDVVREVVDVLMPADRTELAYSISLKPWVGGAQGAGDSDE